MKLLYLAFSTTVTLALSAPLVEAANWKRIKSESAFLELVDGKSLSRGSSTAKIESGGKGSGKTESGRYTLNWVWDKGRYCRNFRFGNSDPTGTVCAKIHVDGNQIRFTSTKDNSSSIWTIN
ncbi:MAG: hypothetical protein AB3N11_08755 [Arenibacterium sp.]